MPDQYELKHWERYGVYSHEICLNLDDVTLRINDSGVSIWRIFDNLLRRESEPAYDMVALRSEALAVARHHWGEQWEFATAGEEKPATPVNP